MQRRTFLTVAAAGVVTAACGGHDDAGPGAAEPASAPPTTVAAVGDVVPVGALPQGIVYAAGHDLLAVAVHDPDRLLLLDPMSLAPRHSVPLAGKVRHLQLSADGNRVLVPVETANELAQVSMPDGAVVSTTRVQSHPHDAAGVVGGDAIVGNEFSGSFSVVRDGAVVATVSDLQQPGGVVVDGDTIAVVDVGAFTVSTYSATTFRRLARVDAGAGPTHGVVLSGHRVAVSDTRGDRVLVFSLDPLELTASYRVAGSPYGLASDAGSDTLWVTLTARNQLVGLDVSTDAPRLVATYSTVRQPDTVSVAPGSHQLWVAGTVDGAVQRIER